MGWRCSDCGQEIMGECHHRSWCRPDFCGIKPERLGAAGVSASEKYVAAAYLVVFVAVLAWVAIISTKLARLEREAGELAELARRRADERSEEREKVSA